MKKKATNYAAGTAALTLLTVLSLISFALPMISGEYSVGILDTIFGKTADGIPLLSRMGIFGVMSSALVLLPVLAVFIISIYPFDRIKKYVVTCFLSIILLIGYMIIYYMLSAKFDGLAGIGFYIGLLLALGILVTAIRAIITDKADKKHKAMVWYNGLNKIVLLVCLPMAVAMIVFTIAMFDLIIHLPVFSSIGVFLLIAGTVVAAVVSVFAVFENYAIGLLYFITGLCCAVGIIFCLVDAGIIALLIGVIMAVVFMAFWSLPARISNKYF